tara:strand:+ start:15885 stop:16010 length:126 start_codon:yes stop_codon:yes gene_type:complete
MEFSLIGMFFDTTEDTFEVDNDPTEDCTVLRNVELGRQAWV